MVAGRGRRRLFAALSALVALIASSAGDVTVGSASTVLFSATDGSIDISSSGDDSRQSIQINLAADKSPLPKKLVIEIPAGYTLDLGAAPGETVAFATIGILGVDSASFAVGHGNLVSKDPGSFLADDEARACAPGTHSAAWEMSTTLVGQRLTVKIFADVSGATGVAYVLHVCASGVAAGEADSVAFISLTNMEGLVSPTSPGAYR